MKAVKKILLTVVLIGVVASVLGAVYFRNELHTPYTSAVFPQILEIPRGIGTREVLQLLQTKRVIKDQNVALAYLVYLGQRGRLQAGEYLFDHPMTIPEVIGKLVGGDVYLHKFTVPEGLTVAETAAQWERQNFGSAQDFAAAAAASLDLIRSFDMAAPTIEGYLFPETYSFPLHTTARQALEAMVNRFRAIAEELKKDNPADKWPLDFRKTVILASLIESEAKVQQERSIIGSVYLNRLLKRMLLQCDPTVIYAMELAGKYRGALQLADLKFVSPYNTYVSAGLPPGPITNPGYASLLAAVHPSDTKYLYFVRTTGGAHTFSETLTAHNRAVAAYRALSRKPKGHT